MLLSRGSLRTAVRASSSIPAVLPAVEIDQRRLVDGGVVAEVPVAAARALGGPVIAFDVSMDLPPLADEDIALDTLDLHPDDDRTPSEAASVEGSPLGDTPPGRPRDLVGVGPLRRPRLGRRRGHELVARRGARQSRRSLSPSRPTSGIHHAGALTPIL